MIKKGEKYVVTKPYGIQVGDVLIVESINGAIILSDEAGKYTVSLTQELFDEYLSPAKKPKRVWTVWKSVTDVSDLMRCSNCPICSGICNFFDFSCGEKFGLIKYRHNGKIVQVKCSDGDHVITASASCCPDDDFDLETGLKIACKRLDFHFIQALYKKKEEEYISDLTEEEEELW